MNNDNDDTLLECTESTFKTHGKIDTRDGSREYTLKCTMTGD